LLARRGRAYEATAKADLHTLWRPAGLSARSAPVAHAVSPGWRSAGGARLAASAGRWAACPAMRPAAQERAEWFRDLLQLPLADVEAVLPALTASRSKDVRPLAPAHALRARGRSPLPHRLVCLRARQRLRMRGARSPRLPACRRAGRPDARRALRVAGGPQRHPPLLAARPRPGRQARRGRPRRQPSCGDRRGLGGGRAGGRLQAAPGARLLCLGQLRCSGGVEARSARRMRNGALLAAPKYAPGGRC